MNNRLKETDKRLIQVSERLAETEEGLRQVNKRLCHVESRGLSVCAHQIGQLIERHLCYKAAGKLARTKYFNFSKAESDPTVKAALDAELQAQKLANHDLIDRLKDSDRTLPGLEGKRCTITNFEAMLHDSDDDDDERDQKKALVDALAHYGVLKDGCLDLWSDPFLSPLERLPV